MVSPCVADEGFIAFRDYHSWYRVERPSLTGPAEHYPLLTLHGGPGATHYGLLPLEQLADQGWPVIFYDQLGCGQSDQPADDSLWTFQLFLDELEVLRAALGLDTVHLLGHGWGGMLALEYLLTHPRGILSLTLVSSIASSPCLLAEQSLFLSGPCFPVDGSLFSLAGPPIESGYRSAVTSFDALYSCRREPWPGFLKEIAARWYRGLYRYMWEPDYKGGSGELCTWDIRPCLADIHLPTLITAGRYDGYTLGQHLILLEGMPHARLCLFEESAHFPHAEETRRYLAVLETFLVYAERQVETEGE